MVQAATKPQYIISSLRLPFLPALGSPSTSLPFVDGLIVTVEALKTRDTRSLIEIVAKCQNRLRTVITTLVVVRLYVCPEAQIV